LSRRVLDVLDKHAAGNGAVRMILETGSYNHAATRLYASAGYEPIPHTSPADQTSTAHTPSS
jgi:hypothetical protein